ncbi:MAG: hypothetical protein PHI53_02755 [Candidatus Pacebacteria bacterium]|nr:hypothetical protein [Candidatus Paceibacterota bacterium]
MKIYYSKKIDKEIHKELNRMGEKLSPVFGHKFPKVKFDGQMSIIASKVAKSMPDFNDGEIKRNMKKIFGKEMPEFFVVLNTIPFSTWNVEEKWISISLKDILTFKRTLYHEANHFMYDYTFGTKKYEDTEIKETITVLNNSFKGVKDNDIGWKKFKEQRHKVWEHYSKKHELRSSVEFAQKLFKKSDRDC